ncbi:MAG: chitobiase/beta-hexosaminidase C-terminal domain-containing protein [Bacteroidaceae bacterium]|nr:chitobiase/beta-hexosaminidase C-terminal domain-containing protein [Bacteroidaceae bacterium]
MKKKLRKTFALKALMLVAMLVGGFNGIWAQSDYSSDYTGNVTLSTTGGSNASACVVAIGGTNYDGIKAGTSSKTGAVMVTVPSGTKYLHLHAAAWNNTTVSLSVTPDGYSESIALTANSGIAGNSPFTISDDANVSDFYKVITFSSALTADTDLTFTAVGGKRFVIWGVSAEEETNTNPNKQNVTLSFPQASYEVNLGENFEAPVLTNESQVNVTFSSSDEDVATVGTDGAVTIKAAGTTTITAKFEGNDTYNEASAHYTLKVVDPNAPGTENNPYTVAQARAAIDAGTGVSGVYATGIVSEIVTAYNSGYGNVSFNITVDGLTTSDALQAYRCTGDAASELAEGDIVVVYGNLTKYNTTYEFGAGCNIVSLTHPAAAVEKPTFSPEAGIFADAQSVTISCETSGAAIYYTLDGTTPTANSMEYTGAIPVRTTTTIKAIAIKGSDESAVATATYHINSQASPYTVAQALAFVEYPANGIYVHGFVSTGPTQAPTSNGEMTYYISEDGTATNQLQVYKGKGLDNAAFEAQTDIKVGDEVTIYGNVKIYNGQKEFDTGNYLVAFNRPEADKFTLTWTDAENITLHVFDAADEKTPLQSGVELAAGTTVMISPDVTAGYDMDAFFVTDAVGNEYPLAGPEGGFWTFTMPSTDAAIVATAQKLEPVVTLAGTSKTLDAVIPEGESAVTASIELNVQNYSGDMVTKVIYCDADGTAQDPSPYTWITIDINKDNEGKMYVSGHAFESNTTSEVRKAYAKVCVTIEGVDYYTELITFTQKAAQSQTTGDAFVKITSTNDLEDGDYLIVYEDGALAFNGGLETLDYTDNTVSVEIANDAIAKTDANYAAIFTIAAVDGGYSIKAANGQYIGQTTDANGLKAQDEAITNTISFTTDGDALISAGGAFLRYNAASNQNRFRYYKSSSYTGQKAIYLYKLGGEPDTRQDVALAFENVPQTINLNETASYAVTSDVDGLPITYSTSDENIVMVDENTGEIGALALGTATITATFAGTDAYKPATAKYTIEVVDPRQEVTLTFGNVPNEININETATYAATADVDGLTITYASSNENILTVDAAGKITAKAKGDATITATFAGNDSYKPATASYTISVVDPNAQTTYYALVGELNGEYFALTNSVSGGTFAATQVGVVNGKVVTPQNDDIAWEIRDGSTVYIVNKAKNEQGNPQYLGHGSNNTTLTIQNASSDTQSKWTADTDKNTWVNGNRSFIYRTTAGGFKNYATSNVNKDDYASFTTAYEFAEGYSRVVANGAWGTICLPNNVAATDYVGAKFYTVFGKVLDAQGNPTKIGLQEVTGALEAGKPYIFNAASTMVAAAYGRVSVDAAGNDGVLFGSFEGEDVAEGMYILSGGKVVKCGTGCTIGANRAYIDLSNAEVKQESDLEGLVKFFVGDSADAINAINAAQNGAVMYDLAGRRVNAAKAGLYIVNGKKVAVK